MTKDNMNQKQKLSKEKLNQIRELRKNQTPQEIILWSKLRNRGVKGLKFRRQYPIGKYITDFACFEKKIVIELDGWQHKTDEGKTHDKERSEFLKNEGFRILRFWNNEVNRNLEGVILKIEDEVEK